MQRKEAVETEREMKPNTQRHRPTTDMERERRHGDRKGGRGDGGREEGRKEWPN